MFRDMNSGSRVLPCVMIVLACMIAAATCASAPLFAADAAAVEKAAIPDDRQKQAGDGKVEEKKPAVKVADEIAGDKDDKGGSIKENRTRPMDIEAKSPVVRRGISLPEALAVDFFVPGGGMFYHENYYAGALFAAAKLGGVWSIYYFYREWEYRQSLYRSARKANKALDPDHELRFRVPGEGYKTVEQMRHDYDRAAQNITFAAFGTAAAFAISFAYTWIQVEKINEKTIPTFDIAMSCATLNQWDFRFNAGYSCRF
ncbi:MAG: hypothetical protein EPN93_02290 [Spirochaetes bacterium]|nr:MAG: hypothetical protein EPN93_02290 [Spirochaetota bacterium]